MKKFSDIPTTTLESWNAELFKIHDELKSIHGEEYRERASIVQRFIKDTLVASGLPCEVMFSILYTGTIACLNIIIRQRKRIEKNVTPERHN